MTTKKRSSSFDEELFLENLFSDEEHHRESTENGSLSEVPPALSQRLYAIADSESHTPQPSHSDPKAKPTFSAFLQSLRYAWQPWAGVTAAVLVAVLIIQVAQQRQSITELENAQRDLKLALQYLHEANKTAEARVLKTLGDNMQKASVTPVVESIYPIAGHINEPIVPTEL